MILAAGEGRRMRPLTDNTPKPLLEVGGKSLIQHQIERLKAAGIEDMLINLAYLGEQIEAYLGDGSALGVNLTYSTEPYPLETGGAISKAMDYLGASSFILANADVWSDFDYSNLLSQPLVSSNSLARLVMVRNPGFHKTGDFALDRDGLLRLAGEGTDGGAYTYSGMALMSPALISEYPERREKFPLREVFDRAINRGQIEGVVHSGAWRDIGTPERLRELDVFLLGGLDPSAP